MTKDNHYSNVINVEKFRNAMWLKRFSVNHSEVDWVWNLGDIRKINAFYKLVLIKGTLLLALPDGRILQAYLINALG